MIRRVLKALSGRPRVAIPPDVAAAEAGSAIRPESEGGFLPRGLGGGLPAIRIYNDRDGVPQNTVLALAFDHQGYLWIGTEDGAARYDGRSWRVMSMPNRTESNHVRVILAATDGSLWFGTHGSGVVILRDGEWSVIRRADGLPDDIVIALCETRDGQGRSAFWVGTKGGLTRIEDRTCVSYTASDGLPHDVVTAIHEVIDPHCGRSLWVGTRGGLARLANGEWTRFGSMEGLGGDTVLTLCDTPSATGGRILWAGTAFGGLSRFDGRHWKTFCTMSGLPANRIHSIVRATDTGSPSALWLGTLGGLVHFDEGAIETFDVRSGLPNNTILRVLSRPEDGGQTVWFGTDGGGLARMIRNRWIGFDARSGLPDQSVVSMCETRAGHGGESVIWFGTDEGIARIDGCACSSVGVDDGLAGPIVTSLAGVVDGDGRPSIYAGMGPGGLAEISNDGSSVMPVEQIPSDVGVMSLLADGSGASTTVWAGSDAGLWRLRNGEWSRFGLESGLPHLYVKCLATTTESGRSILWAGTIGGGLVRFDGDAFQVFDAARGFPNNYVLSVCVVALPGGRRELWAGTMGAGIARRPLGQHDAVWTSLSTRTSDAIRNDTVNQIVCDSSGRIYVFTNKGVSRLTPLADAAGDGDEFESYTYTTDDGLPSNESNAGAAMVDGAGRIWIGTVGGAAVLDPLIEFDDRRPKPLHLRAFVGGRSARWIENGTTLRHNENDVTFEFDLLSYFREGDTMYRAQLVGFDERCSEWTTEWKRNYTNLPSGRFAFEVWGRDYAGNVSGPTTLRFEVQRAPWRTWWAYLGYAGAAAGAAYGGVQWRLHTMRRRTEALEATVKFQTAELAAKIDQLRFSEATTREKADELAIVVEQLRAAERNALRAKGEAIAAKDRALEASHAKSVFLSSMSHELRTPLNAVLGFAQLLDRDAGLTHDQRDHLAAIMSSGEHLLHLINDVLSLSKIEAGKLVLSVQPFDLHRTLDGVEAMLRGRARSKGLRLAVDRADSVPRQVMGDEGKLRQVLINILGNAVKFTETGSVLLRVSWRDGIATFVVTDTGPGIAADEIDGLFEPFAQSETGRKAKEGTGLGLAISRNFVEMMGGHIGVTSTPGRGSNFTFDVELPEASGAPLSRGRRAIMELEPGQREFRVLIVDDEERNRLLLVKFLTTVGFSVSEAADGREAIAVWASWKPHAILMDMRMPVMNGREATREIRRLEREAGPDADGEIGAGGSRARTVIVSLTASAFEHERDEILGAGCDDFLTKPFREDALFEMLARHLGARFLRAGGADGFRGDEARAIAALDPDHLRGLPAEVRGMLIDAVVKGDVERASHLVRDIAARDEMLSAHLVDMIRNYRFDELQELLDRASR